MGEKMNRLTAAAGVLGITVVGALIPSVINARVPFVFSSGEVSLELQSVLNQIMPSLVPVALVALIYWLLGNKAILFVMALGIVLSVLGILG